MTNESLNEYKLKVRLVNKIKLFALASYNIAKANSHFFSAFILTFISVIYYVGILYPSTWQPQLAFRQSWFGIICILIYIITSILLVFFSKLNNFRKVSTWIQSNILMIISFAYFLRLSHREFIINNLNLSTGFIFIFLALLIFLVNYNLFGKNERKEWLLIPQVVLFALQGYAFLSLTGTYITDSTSFSSDWLNILFNLHPYFWLAISALSIAIISILSLDFLSIELLFKFLGLFSFLMIQGILVIYLINFVDVNLYLTYWNLALMALVYWDYLNSPLKTIIHKIEDNRFITRIVVSTFYHGALFLLIVLAPQLQSIFR